MDDYRDCLLKSAETFIGNTIALLGHVTKSKDSSFKFNTVFDMARLLGHSARPLLRGWDRG